ncbi:XisI protein [Leptolyngbya sp. AN03gr2]|uniref:XisI protein n=1 Tax=unclassified Leptolyngbya TaxID=2650499 RepID=UPI003D31469A
MDTNLKQAILTVLQNYLNFLGNDADTQLQMISDETNNHYLLVELGWQNGRRIYGALIHLDIINEKIWIQQDGTEDGIASELVAIGIPKQQIVLGFKSEQRRRITEFAPS